MTDTNTVAPIPTHTLKVMKKIVALLTPLTDREREFVLTTLIELVLPKEMP